MPDSQPDARSSAPVDTRVENTKHLAQELCLWLQPGDGAGVKWHRSSALQTTKEMFSEALGTCTSKDVLFIIKFYHM